MLNRLKALIQGGSSEGSHEKNQPVPKKRAAKKSGWIGVDLDGTLAEYTAWKGIGHIGKPIELMAKRVNAWTDEGYTVKIMTARASVAEGIPPVEAWLAKHGLPQLEVTNQKDFEMLELWDDRAIQVIANSGRPVLRLNHLARPKAPMLRDEKGDETCELTK